MCWIRRAILILLAGTLAARGGNIGVDASAHTAWGENIGWANAAPNRDGVLIHFDGSSGWLSGYAWCENVGWIKLGAGTGPYPNTGAADWGVNLDGAGVLSGYAWGENIGWVKFDPASGGVTVNFASGALAGHAWGENVGWLRFSGAAPDYGVRTLAFDAQAWGTPNWWLDHYGVNETYDEGDGEPAWREYVADTDPNDAGSYLRIVAVSDAPVAPSVAFWPASTRRYYTLSSRPSLQSGAWGDVAGQSGIQGAGGQQVLRDGSGATHGSPAPQMFYRMKVSVSP